MQIMYIIHRVFRDFGLLLPPTFSVGKLIGLNPLVLFKILYLGL